MTTKKENGLNVKFVWESVVSLSDFIKLCEYLNKNPLAAAFEVEVSGRDDVIR